MSGIVVWVTGLPQSGKSTLARRVVRALRGAGRVALLLDADALRETLVPPPGYAPEERDAFYLTLGGLAGLLADQDVAVIVPGTAHRRAHRQAARARAPAYLEVFVDVPSAEAARRDEKGLYARARAGEIAALPGLGVPYEPPERPDVTATGGQDHAAVEAVVEKVQTLLDARATD